MSFEELPYNFFFLLVCVEVWTCSYRKSFDLNVYFKSVVFNSPLCMSCVCPFQYERLREGGRRQDPRTFVPRRRTRKPMFTRMTDNTVSIYLGEVLCPRRGRSVHKSQCCHDGVLYITFM